MKRYFLTYIMVWTHSKLQELVVISTSPPAKNPMLQPCRPRDRQAFAKVLGGYHRLKEGSTAWALGQMTGDQPRSRRFS